MTTALATPPARQTEHDILPLFLHRWSPRAYTGEEIPDAVLFAAFEAARWAPSGSNAQPWRFLYAKRGGAKWPLFLDLLLPGNRAWAEKASALILIVSKKTGIRQRDGQIGPLPSRSFDSGAAWQNFSLQANASGWHTRGIGGYDREKARPALRVPEDYDLENFVAIGKQADRSTLSEELQQKEAPTSRLPLQELVLEGGF